MLVLRVNQGSVDGLLSDATYLGLQRLLVVAHNVSLLHSEGVHLVFGESELVEKVLDGGFHVLHHGLLRGAELLKTLQLLLALFEELSKTQLSLCLLLHLKERPFLLCDLCVGSLELLLGDGLVFAEEVKLHILFLQLQIDIYVFGLHRLGLAHDVVDAGLAIAQSWDLADQNSLLELGLLLVEHLDFILEFQNALKVFSLVVLLNLELSVERL